MILPSSTKPYQQDLSQADSNKEPTRIPSMLNLAERLGNKPEWSEEDYDLIFSIFEANEAEVKQLRQEMQNEAVCSAVEIDRAFIEDSEHIDYFKSELDSFIVNAMIFLLHHENLKALCCKSFDDYYNKRLQNAGVSKNRFNAHAEAADFCYQICLEYEPETRELIDACLTAPKSIRLGLYRKLIQESGSEAGMQINGL